MINRLWEVALVILVLAFAIQYAVGVITPLIPIIVLVALVIGGVTYWRARSRRW